MKRFIKIAFTAEDFIDDEAAKIEQVLKAGIDYVHIRKPNVKINELRELISAINPVYHPKLKLHDHFSLIHEFNIGGVHLNSRNLTAPDDAKSVTRSCHSVEELEDCSGFEYVTLSPIFDSISKQGYKSAFNLDDLTDKIENKNVIALGGVTPYSFSLLSQAGFVGAAMLGCVWGNVDEFCKQL